MDDLFILWILITIAPAQTQVFSIDHAFRSKHACEAAIPEVLQEAESRFPNATITLDCRVKLTEV
jgi:hypothetical protein